LRGWYGYGWASEVYSAVAIAVFIPLILEAIASEDAVQAHDHSLPCNTTLPGYQCDVQFMGYWIDTSAYSLYTISLSVLLQAITFIGLGALADHGAWRKNFMLGFALIGSIATILFLFIFPHSGHHIFASILTIISNLSFGASYVFFYAFIPVLTRRHPKTEEARLKGFSPEELVKVEDSVANEISAHGFAIGYGAGFLLLIICAVIAWMMDATTYR